jgi:hypothetical protein
VLQDDAEVRGINQILQTEPCITRNDVNECLGADVFVKLEELNCGALIVGLALVSLRSVIHGLFGTAVSYENGKLMTKAGHSSCVGFSQREGFSATGATCRCAPLCARATASIASSTLTLPFREPVFLFDVVFGFVLRV